MARIHGSGSEIDFKHKITIKTFLFYYIIDIVWHVCASYYSIHILALHRNVDSCCIGLRPLFYTKVNKLNLIKIKQ